MARPMTAVIRGPARLGYRRAMHTLGPVVGFVGPSSVGKTSLLEAVVAALQRRRLWVGVVKHSCHEVEPDRAGKDSSRLYAAGADAVALAGSNLVASFVRRDTPPGLRDALLALPPGLDLVLVEGFAWEPIPRYVVLPVNGSDPARYGERGPVLRTLVAPPARPGRRPEFAPALVREIVDELAARAEQPRPLRSGAAL